jgi:chorismate mutase / prephenate dehydratase
MCAARRIEQYDMRQDSELREELRREAETIDRRIHDLLLRRAEIAQLERDQTAPAAGPMRAAQFAVILRGILSRRSDRFPLRALVRIWSDILFAGDTQTTLHIHGGEDVLGFRDLARTHFGCTMPMVSHGSAAAVVHACADDPRALGLVPPPETVDNGQTWWEQLAPMDHAGPRIAQSLPFVRNDPGPVPLPQGYAIATIDQEPTGTDTTVLRLECYAELSRARLQSLLRQAGFDAQILAASRDASKGSASRLLVAVNGFVAADDERLASIAAKAGDSIERVSLVGVFADPFDAQPVS